MIDTSQLFSVQIATYNESHRTTYHVVLMNSDRPADAFAFDKEGSITPYFSETREYAVHSAKEWARFLGVKEPEPCNCILCDRPEKPDATA